MSGALSPTKCNWKVTKFEGRRTKHRNKHRSFVQLVLTDYCTSPRQALVQVLEQVNESKFLSSDYSHLAIAKLYFLYSYGLGKAITYYYNTKTK